jgi:hypothetical protein
MRVLAFYGPPARMTGFPYPESAKIPLAHSLPREIENDPKLRLMMALWPKLPEPLRDALARWPEIPEAIRRAILALLETVPN